MNQPDDDGAQDFTLMKQIAGGNESAFRALLTRHQDSVVGTVAKMLGNPSDAEDIAQQVFLRVWTHAKSYRPDAKFTTYLFTITRNLVFNETRRRSRKKEIPLDTGDSSGNHEPGDDPHRQPDASLLEAELRIAVDKAIASLPETQRLAVSSAATKTSPTRKSPRCSSSRSQPSKASSSGPEVACVRP